MNFRLFMSVIPVAVFLGLDRLGAPAVLAIGFGFAASTAVFFWNRKDRLIGALTLFGFVVVAISAMAGIIWSNEKAYLAAGPLTDFLFIPMYLGSIALRQPLVGGIARELVPGVAGKLPVNAPVFVGLSFAWAAYDLAHGVLRAYLLNELSVGEYVVWSRLISWPFSAALLGLTVWLIVRAAGRHEQRGLALGAAVA
jgi:hypothetical protein